MPFKKSFLLLPALLLAVTAGPAVAAPAAEPDPDVVAYCAPGQEEIEVDAAGAKALTKACADYDKAFKATLGRTARQLAQIDRRQARLDDLCKRATEKQKKSRCRAAERNKAQAPRLKARILKQQERALEELADDFFTALEDAGLFGEEEDEGDLDEDEDAGDFEDEER